MAFADHFSSQAPDYAAFRPRYPDALGEWLASVTPGHDLAWDCATGSGQAATMLARHFREIVATDASAAQIANADPHARVSYRVAPAHVSGLADHSCDLVTVAQAAHWLDLPRFYDEARRVLKPNGVIAVWCYVLLHTGRPGIDNAVRAFQYERVEKYWPPGRELVDDEYRSLVFPFEPIDAPAFEMMTRWTREDLLGYVGTWSAVARCRQVEGHDPLPEFAEALVRVWPDASERIDVRWPLFLKAGRGRDTVR
jgi:ubiquinone/menaquinone biosynthesis C-methylase UbiE